jgi:hypothetical protein
MMPLLIKIFTVQKLLHGNLKALLELQTEKIIPERMSSGETKT